MINYVKALAFESHDDRKTALIKLLDDLGLHYNTQKKVINDLLVENFVVRFGTDENRILIGAHYDSVKGSTGANDNGSGVAILLELVKVFMQKQSDISIDIVFFDYEEGLGYGSTLYHEICGDSVQAMINVDICGVGDTILIAPKKNLISGILSKAVNNINIQDHKYEIIDKLPVGDERIFEENNIPNISLCIVDQSDVEPMTTLFSGTKDIKPEDFPSIIETMHNGCRDSIDVVQEDALEKVYAFLIALLQV